MDSEILVWFFTIFLLILAFGYACAYCVSITAIPPLTASEFAAVWIVTLPKRISYALGKFFHGLVGSGNIYDFNPRLKRLERAWEGNLQLLRSEQLINANALHVELFGEKMRGPFNSHLEFDQVIQQLFLMEDALLCARSMLERCSEIKECRDLQKKFVVNGEFPSIQNLFVFFLSEDHWDSPRKNSHGDSGHGGKESSKEIGNGK